MSAESDAQMTRLLTAAHKGAKVSIVDENGVTLFEGNLKTVNLGVDHMHGNISEAIIVPEIHRD